MARTNMQTMFAEAIALRDAQLAAEKAGQTAPPPAAVAAAAPPAEVAAVAETVVEPPAPVDTSLDYNSGNFDLAYEPNKDMNLSYIERVKLQMAKDEAIRDKANTMSYEDATALLSGDISGLDLNSKEVKMAYDKIQDTFDDRGDLSDMTDEQIIGLQRLSSSDLGGNLYTVARGNDDIPTAAFFQDSYNDVMSGVGKEAVDRYGTSELFTEDYAGPDPVIPTGGDLIGGLLPSPPELIQGADGNPYTQPEDTTIRTGGGMGGGQVGGGQGPMNYGGRRKGPEGANVYQNPNDFQDWQSDALRQGHDQRMGTATGGPAGSYGGGSIWNQVSEQLPTEQQGSMGDQRFGGYGMAADPNPAPWVSPSQQAEEAAAQTATNAPGASPPPAAVAPTGGAMAGTTVENGGTGQYPILTPEQLAAIQATMTTGNGGAMSGTGGGGAII